MSYSSHSLGVDFPKGAFVAPNFGQKGAGLAPAPAGVPMVDVGVDGGIVRSLAAVVRDAGEGMVGCSGEPWCHKGSYLMVASALNSLRLNEFGRYSPAAVRGAILALGPDRIGYVDALISGRRPRPLAAAMGGYTISKLLADIAAGKYAGSPAPTRANLVRAGIKMPLPGGGLLTKTPLKDPEPPPAREGVKEVMCTDGYVRDAAGLCVPGAAPPIPTVKPATVEEPKKDETQPTNVIVADEKKDEPFVADQYGPPGPGPMIETQILPPPSEVLPESKGPLGVAWRWWGLGAVTVVGVGLWMSSSSNNVTPNKRRSRSRSR